MIDYTMRKNNTLYQKLVNKTKTEDLPNNKSVKESIDKVSQNKIQYYLKEASHSCDDEDLFLNDKILDALWSLFMQIGIKWKNMTEEQSYTVYSQWLTFIYNRIHFNPRYIAEYDNATNIIICLGDKVWDVIFTIPETSGPIVKPLLERAKLYVIDEFIAIQLALGGFKSFGAINYLGYFGGANKKNEPPYRTLIEL